MAFNILISVFSMMFTIFNSILIAMIFKSNEIIVRNFLIATMFLTNLLTIIFTNFSLNDHMATNDLVTIIVSIFYSILLLTSFIWILGSIY